MEEKEQEQGGQEEHPKNEKKANHEQQQKKGKEQAKDEKEGKLGTDVVDSTLEKKSEEMLRRNRLNNSLLSTSQPSRFDSPPPFHMKKPKVRNTFLSNKQFEEFVNLIRKVNVNVSFYDLLTSFSKYTKFMKDLIANKNKVKEQMEIMPLSTNCSLIL